MWDSTGGYPCTVRFVTQKPPFLMTGGRPVFEVNLISENAARATCMSPMSLSRVTGPLPSCFDPHIVPVVEDLSEVGMIHPPAGWYVGTSGGITSRYSVTPTSMDLRTAAGPRRSIPTGREAVPRRDSGTATQYPET